MLSCPSETVIVRGASHNYALSMGDAVGIGYCAARRHRQHRDAGRVCSYRLCEHIELPPPWPTSSRGTPASRSRTSSTAQGRRSCSASGASRAVNQQSSWLTATGAERHRQSIAQVATINTTPSACLNVATGDTLAPGTLYKQCWGRQVGRRSGRVGRLQHRPAAQQPVVRRNVNQPRQPADRPAAGELPSSGRRGDVRRRIGPVHRRIRSTAGTSERR
jgi:hypothetical protein